jgi:osmotically inducible lipoprotein OsmB
MITCRRMSTMYRIVAVSLVAFSLAGCGSSQAMRTATGAAIGAGTGALAGSAVAGSAGAVVGGLGGAAAGAVVGSRM